MNLIIISAEGSAPHNLGKSFFEATPYCAEYDRYAAMSPVASISVSGVKRAERILMLLARLCPDMTIEASLQINAEMVRAYTVESGAFAVRLLSLREMSEKY